MWHKRKHVKQNTIQSYKQTNDITVIEWIMSCNKIPITKYVFILQEFVTSCDDLHDNNVNFQRKMSILKVI